MFANAAPEKELREQLRTARTVLDLGSGPNPIAGATAAVDLFVDARQRAGGAGEGIDKEAFIKQGIRFVNQSIDAPLPFSDHEFDFAYSSHAIEHVEHPGKACDEMMRVASAGLVRCPAAMMEFMCGRPYHRWLVLQRGPRLLFIEKARDEYEQFGAFDATSAEKVNPFEALLDWEGERPRTPSRGIMGRLKSRLQEMFYRRLPQSEINLFWRNGFTWSEVHLDGSTTQGGRPGAVCWFSAEGKRMEAQV